MHFFVEFTPTPNEEQCLVRCYQHSSLGVGVHIAFTSLYVMIKTIPLVDSGSNNLFRDPQ